jgi:DNA-binding transcriptional MerR regulator
MRTIGQLSEVTGVPTSTIRFWERKGLLPPTTREGGQRRYDEDARRKLARLRVCQESGFTLDEIKRMLDAADSNPGAWRAFVAAKLTDIEQNLERLNHAHEMLSHALECTTGPHLSQCPHYVELLDQRMTG